MGNFIKRSVVFLIAGILISSCVMAQLVMPEIFSDNMVLQRDKPVPVWGTATPGKTVTVSFGGNSQTVTADNTGNWKIMLPSMSANAVPQSMTVQEESSIVFKNILVGDVWLCSGQSNMEYRMELPPRYKGPQKGPDLAALELKAAKPAGVRYIVVEKVLNKYPKLPTKGWVTGEDSMVRFVSAIGYFFAKEINSKINVPIGVITSAWGGTRIEPWVPETEWGSSAVFKDSVQREQFTIHGARPGNMYKALISPMVPFAIKGVLWYQGESNVLIHDQETYGEKFRLLVDSWRKLFNDVDMPFYYVQLAPHTYSGRKDPKSHKEDLLPYYWESQASSLILKNTGMVVTTDLVDDLADIHPSYKWEIARRLSLTALHGVYQQNGIVYSGPMFAAAKRKKKAIELSFEHIGGGLASSDGKPLSCFSIAGSDNVFVPAEAVIRGNKVVVSAPSVKRPLFVRFGWSEKAQPNFINKEGLPAVPFRTDNILYKD